MSQDTAYHAPINVDALEHRDGAWMCSPDGADEAHDRSRWNSPMLIVVVVVLLPIAVAAVVLAVRFFIQR